MKRLGWMLAVTGACWALHAESPATFAVSDFKFKRPEKWAWIETSSAMRKAQLKVMSADGKATGDVIFFHFGPGNGGGTQANVDRWLGQFQEPREKLNSKIEELTIRGKKISYVRAEGTYLSGMPGGPKTPMPDAMLLGAILESDGGSVFVRLTAPKELAKASEADFRKLVESGVP